jgi:hypothetical protein
MRLEVSTGGTPLPVRILDPSLRIVAAGESDDVFWLDPGDYLIELSLPSGRVAEVTRRFGDEETHLVDFREEVGYLGRGSACFDEIAAERGPEGGWDVALEGWPHRYTTFDEGASLRTTPNVQTVAAVESSSGDRAGFIVNVRREGTYFVHFDTGSAATLHVALPAVADEDCFVIAERRRDRMRVRTFPTGKLSAFAGDYLRPGRENEGLRVLARHDLEGLVTSPDKDPAGAAIYGYLLLREGRLKALAAWAGVFADQVPWMPDAHVIAGVAAARLGDDEAALRHLIHACNHGVPVFSEGVALATAMAIDKVRDPLPSWDVTTRASWGLVLSDLGVFSPFVDYSVPETAFRLPWFWPPSRPWRTREVGGAPPAVVVERVVEQNSQRRERGLYAE